jgi:hypothetical protein
MIIFGNFDLDLQLITDCKNAIGSTADLQFSPKKNILK